MWLVSPGGPSIKGPDFLACSQMQAFYASTSILTPVLAPQQRGKCHHLHPLSSLPDQRLSWDYPQDTLSDSRLSRVSLLSCFLCLEPLPIVLLLNSPTFTFKSPQCYDQIAQPLTYGQLRPSHRNNSQDTWQLDKMASPKQNA